MQIDSSNSENLTPQWCSRCQQYKPSDQFYSMTSGYCKPCARAYRKERYQGNSRIKFEQNIRRLYGITLQQYEKMLWDQNGYCAICGDKPERDKGSQLYVDHCHATGRVRGLLCHNCNSGLGHFRDDTKRMQKAIEYIETASTLQKIR